nr:DnaB-like helicase C-terminal domain-containing protein [Microbacterium lushaniae]
MTTPPLADVDPLGAAVTVTAAPRAGEADLIVAKHRNGPTDTITVAFQGHYSRFTDMAPEM